MKPPALFDMKNTMYDAVEPVRFLWNAMAASLDQTAVWGSVSDYEKEYGDAKPFFIISDKQDTIDWCRTKGIWLFDVVENPKPKPFGERILVAFDVDGTIADLGDETTGRRRFLAKKDQKTGKRKGKSNWAAFDAAVIHDTVHEEVAFFFRLLRTRQDVDLIILTARRGTDKMVADTTKWLTKNNLDGYQKMYIRDADDYRSDSETKIELLGRIDTDFGRKPDFIVDDRPSVSATMRDAGIFVFNVCQDGIPF